MLLNVNPVKMVINVSNVSILHSMPLSVLLNNKEDGFLLMEMMLIILCAKNNAKPALKPKEIVMYVK